MHSCTHAHPLLHSSAVLGVLVGESGLNFFSSDINGPAIFQYQQAEGLFNAWSFNVVGLTLAVEVRPRVIVQLYDP